MFGKFLYEETTSKLFRGTTKMCYLYSSYLSSYVYYISIADFKSKDLLKKSSVEVELYDVL
ncbi:MAG TPA: hypothetical protein PLG10_00665 [Candidatus Dojkabacteria bacterium]|nr:hypothetical protein [Candidatus Dojkabacteria bacterium]